MEKEEVDIEVPNNYFTIFFNWIINYDLKYLRC